ncbi:hypothetical protein DL96DRAFT_1594148 [Flagelloscypha sp. PMI_526]|nr:hypothetical protein DL96DRAFT_1594148 [Flagelloscypha sp. PMI_526]
MDATALFNSYEQDFSQIIDTINTNLASKETGEPLRALLRHADIQLDEADELVSQLGLEISSIPVSQKSQYTSRLQKARQTLSSTKKALKEANARFSLLSSQNTGDNPYHDGGASSDRARLLSGTQMLEDGTKRLQESHRLALDTEAQGAEILRDLRVQGERISHARTTLDSTMGHLDRASSTLSAMVRRMYQDRVVTGAIITVLVLLILVIIYEKLFA